MAAYGAVLTPDDKVNIVSRFLLHAPPGEFNEVFNDVRTLLNDDTLLKDRLSGTFSQYNKDQFTPVRLEGVDQAVCQTQSGTQERSSQTSHVDSVDALDRSEARLQVLFGFSAPRATGDSTWGTTARKVVISEHNDLGKHRFYDPRSKRSFRFDHLRKEASEIQTQELPDSRAEAWRSAFEAHFSNYVDNYYKHGVCSVYAKSEGGQITVVAAIEDHQFQPKNYWNGRWRAQWSLTFTPGSQTTAELRGIIKVQVHYYEDGNVQLVSSKEVKSDVDVTNESDTARNVCQAVLEAENDYQTGVSENYNTMSETTFKALRRQLPLTRTKIDWSKIAGYRVGNEIGGKGS